MINLDVTNEYNIIIVGVGGTGSHLVSFLSQLIGNNSDYKSKHSIILVDGDRVEEKNLRTQKFLPEDVGRLKAEVLAERYACVFNIDITYVDKYIKDLKDLEKLYVNSYRAKNIVVSCVDNNKARKIIDNSFNFTTRPYKQADIYIDTGNSSGKKELVGQTVIAYKEGKDIILPSVGTYFPEVLNDEEEVNEGLSCVEAMIANIQNIGANITSACTTFNILNNIIGFNRINGDIFTFNATTIETQSIKASEKIRHNLHGNR